MTPDPSPPMLRYRSSDPIEPGQVMISHGKGFVEIKIGPLDGRGWIAALSPTAALISVISFVFIVQLRHPFAAIGDVAIALFSLIGCTLTIVLQIRTMGTTRIIRFDAQQMLTRAADDDGEGIDIAIARIMAIRARRIWWMPVIWALVVDGFPKWWNPRNDPHARDFWGGELILLGSKRTVKNALAAVAPFVRDQSPPPIKLWVPWLVTAGVVGAGLIAVWSLHQILAGHGESDVFVWLTPVCIAAAFAFPITANVLVAKGKLRQKPKIAVKNPRRSVMIEGLPPRTMN